MSVNEMTDDGTSSTTSTATPAATARRGGLAVLGLAALLAVMDGTVVTTALGTLSASFGSPLSTLVWVTVAYLLAAATMLPMLGWASARFGPRRLFLAGLVLFTFGSVLASLAGSAAELIAFRVVQGFGGGLLEPMSLTIAASLATPRTMGRVMGGMSTIINVAPIAGPVVGGLLLGTGHWQPIFWMNIPFGVVVFAAALLFLPRDTSAADGQRPRADVRADVRGITLLGVGYLGLLFAVNRLGDGGQWPIAVVSLLIGAALLAAYVRHALRAGAPAFDVRLLRRSGFATALAVMAIVGFTMFSQLTALPLFAEQRFALHGAEQGLLVTALGVGLIFSMTMGGRLSDRTGPRVLVRGGAVGTAVTLALFALVNRTAPLPVSMLVLLAVGASFGFIAAPSFSSVYRLLPSAEQPQGTTAMFMTVQLTASLGVTVVGVLRAQLGGSALTVQYTVLAVLALGVLLLGRGLPGRHTSG